jgi:hypothetical protein
MSEQEQEIESLFYQITLPLNEKKTIYGISLDGFKLVAEKLLNKAYLQGKVEALEEVRTDLKNLITSI